RKWISACLQSATISILVNGSPTKEFVPTRGLRQVDPLAPLLFNIVGEEPTNILQYADHTVFVGEATWENVYILKALLRGFELASGLK
ncbi:hypothetical protein glysoja_047689, partial [Glycine soja]